MNVTRRTAESWFEASREQVLARWLDLLRHPSIGTDPARAADCRRCAESLAADLRASGFSAGLLETGGQPAVFGERPGRPGRPCVLFYGHYDVQPPDPLDRWETPPFEPAVRDGRVYARGAQDNKGQLLYVLKAIEALAREAPDALGPVKVILEGEEESGSHGLSRSIDGWRDRLRADVLLVCDTGMAESGAPAIVMGLRGIAHLTVTLRGARRDLHSGQHGGLAPNPAAGMARLIASLHAPDGRIAVPGFYDGVEPPTPEEFRLMEADPFDPVRYREQIGVEPVAGERGVPPAVRHGFRPTIDVNGIHAGYGGAGSKTVIPAEAMAKLSIRLVAGQDPGRCTEALVAHLRAHTPPGLACEVSQVTVGGPALRLGASSPLVRQASAVLAEVCGREPVCFWEGGSIPVVARLAAASGAEPLLVGFGREEDNLHAPNESFAIDRFKLGFVFACLFLGRVGAAEEKGR